MIKLELTNSLETIEDVTAKAIKIVDIVNGTQNYDYKVQDNCIYLDLDIDQEDSKLQKALFFGLDNVRVYTFDMYYQNRNHWELFK